MSAVRRDWPSFWFAPAQDPPPIFFWPLLPSSFQEYNWGVSWRCTARSRSSSHRTAEHTPSYFLSIRYCSIWQLLFISVSSCLAPRALRGGGDHLFLLAPLLCSLLSLNRSYSLFNSKLCNSSGSFQSRAPSLAAGLLLADQNNRLYFAVLRSGFRLPSLSAALFLES